MKRSKILLFFLFATQAAMASSLYNCNMVPPEMAGFHNMVLFGDPDDKLYAYHLPLFSGKTNGTTGHVLMHVYQGLWEVQLDTQTIKAYRDKFLLENTINNPIPFFTISPQKKPFRVPEMFCQPGFSISALAVYGHVENNPDFPAPQELIKQVSTVSVVGKPIFARRFDGSSKSALTFVLFGTSKHYYMAHFLTDDEDSFDQIVEVDILSVDLKEKIKNKGSTLVTVDVIVENHLELAFGAPQLKSPNNKWRLSTDTIGNTINVNEVASVDSGKIKIIGRVYFNKNEDLKK
ncbi:MAG: hypothetical protein H6623_04620 [Bdellovibrionaceae bacterium]|nr:hypothetical protein [Pseudobdellovibrionaceae bacterium]